MKIIRKQLKNNKKNNKTVKTRSLRKILDIYIFNILRTDIVVATRKIASINFCKFFSLMQWSNKKLWLV